MKPFPLHPDESWTVAQARTQGDTFPGLRDCEREDWYILPICNGRDNSALDRSNFRVVIADLGGESDTLEVHRFGHWAVGFYEVAIIHPTRRAEADAWRKALNNYPVACDMDFSDLENEEEEADTRDLAEEADTL